MQKKTKCPLSRWFPFCWRDLVITTIILFFAAGLCILLQQVASDGFASPVFVLAVVLISRLTTGYLFGLIAAVAGVVCVNFIFTYPYWEVDFTLAGYPLTFFTFLTVSIITSALTTQVRQQERLRGETEKEKMRANLLRSVSHDIRTPLTSIVGSTSAVLENPGLSEQERRELLEDVRDEAQWLIRVVENLLSITRMGEDQARITKDPEAVEEVLGEAVRKFRRRFPNVEVTVSVPRSCSWSPWILNPRSNRSWQICWKTPCSMARPLTSTSPFLGRNMMLFSLSGTTATASPRKTCPLCLTAP